MDTTKHINTNFPSRYNIDDYVHLQFFSDQKPMLCWVTAVHFTSSKVKYDLAIILNLTEITENNPIDTTRIYNVDSLYVHDLMPEEEEQ